MPAATEVFELPGAGYITGSNGTYQQSAYRGFLLVFIAGW